MVRRSAYTKLNKRGFNRPAHVAGMGDVVWRVFQCLRPSCTNQVVVREAALQHTFEVACGTCAFVHRSGDALEIFEYELIDKRDGSVVEAGPFEVLHDDYVMGSSRQKYCVLCGAMKPLESFDRHSARASGRQGECNLCKQTYNSIKNQTRTSDQFRDASQKRRLYTQFDDDGKIDVAAIYKRFNGSCFKCGVDLMPDLRDEPAAKLGNLDHTLPVFYLWPLTVDNATLLCRKHNGEKAEKWPSQYYNDAELRRLSALTGIEYKILAGEPRFNPSALERLRDSKFVATLFEKFARYPDELLRLRNRILRAEKWDFLSDDVNISNDWRVKANALL